MHSVAGPPQQDPAQEIPAETPDKETDPADEMVQPRVVVEPGRNLFGELIDDSPADETKVLSHRRKRVAAMVERVLDLSARQSAGNQDRQKTSKKLQELRAEQSQLPTQMETLAAEAVQGELRMAELRSGGVLQLPPSSPSAIRFRQLSVGLTTRYANLKRLQARSRVLPSEIVRTQNSLAVLNRTHAELAQDTLDLLVSVREAMGPLTWVPTEDAAAIASQCEVTLDQYPELGIVRLLDGYARFHIGQFQTAHDQFSLVLEQHAPSSNRLDAGFQFLSYAGRAWSAIETGDLDRAGRDLAAARRLAAKDYELAVAIATLSEKRGRPSSAFEQYRTAARFGARLPHAYRMAATLVIESQCRPPATAVALAKMASDCDEQDDWRNHLALALAYRAAGKQDEFDASLRRAREAADAEARQKIEEFLQPATSP